MIIKFAMYIHVNPDYNLHPIIIIWCVFILKIGSFL